MQDFGVNSKNLKPMKKILSKETKNFYPENRKLEAAVKNADSENKGIYTKIGGLELGKVNLAKEDGNDLIQENNELAASSKRLEALNERLNRENTSLNQKISTLSLDKDAQRARLADLEAFLKTKDSQLKESELKLDDALDELDTTRNEVARLSGTETLLNDRYAMLKGENETSQDKIRSLNVGLNALREEIQSLAVALLLI